LTLETRPDYITRQELQRLRRFGCTRVQIGVQHTDNDVLKYINRGCQREDAVRAVRLLKDAAFKVDIHLMPDLPSSDPDKDTRMFEYVLSSPELQVDQWKIYPCEVTPFSKIEEWHRNGEYHPYADDDNGIKLEQLLIGVKSAVHPWIRLNRVVRDIPNQSIIAGNSNTNLRQKIIETMKQRQLFCRCIRCREVKGQKIEQNLVELKIRQYDTLGGEEYFLSYESKDERTIFGFLRLRIRTSSSDKRVPFQELEGAALIRELHVYGQLVRHAEKNTGEGSQSQHRGFGTRLLAAAEAISVSKGLRKAAVISGVGARQYYEKFGYVTEGTYMTKLLEANTAMSYGRQVLGLDDLYIQKYDMSTIVESPKRGPDSSRTSHCQEMKRLSLRHTAQTRELNVPLIGLVGATTIALLVLFAYRRLK